MGADRKLVADFVYQKSFLANVGVRRRLLRQIGDFCQGLGAQKKGKEENQDVFFSTNFHSPGSIHGNGKNYLHVPL